MSKNFVNRTNDEEIIGFGNGIKIRDRKTGELIKNLDDLVIFSCSTKNNILYSTSSELKLYEKNILLPTKTTIVHGVFSHDGKLILACSQNGNLILLDFEKIIHNFVSPDFFYCSSFSSDDKMILTACSDRTPEFMTQKQKIFFIILKLKMKYYIRAFRITIQIS